MQYVKTCSHENKTRLSIWELCIFSMLGGIMYASKVIMEILPNVHLLGVFVIALTLVYRKKALYPIYAYIMINGLFAGFSMWWIPYLYIWTLLWAAAMLLPKDTLDKKRTVLCAVLCSIHGFSFGTLYAPAQALLFGLDFKATIAWIVAGLPYDLIHGCSNFALGLLIIPLAKSIKLADKQIS